MEEHHGNMTGHLSRRLARAYGYSEAEAKRIGFAASFHDIGKHHIPGSILNKPDRLTPREFEIIKLHTAYGYNMLQSIQHANGEMMRQIAMYHHERYDGMGYWGLSRDMQPMYVRIVALADVYTALISRRVYKHAWPVDETLDYISAGAGTHFDPDLIELFVPLVRSNATE